MEFHELKFHFEISLKIINNEHNLAITYSYFYYTNDKNYKKAHKKLLNEWLTN